MADQPQQQDGVAPATDTNEPAAAASNCAQDQRAIVLTGFGGVRMVKVQRRPIVKPIEGEVLISVKACGLNFTDLMVRQGAIDNPPKTPFIMGFECAGEVEAVGENVSRFAVGDRVLAVTDYKAWAEHVAVSESFVYKMPTSMSFEEAASLFMNYVTAYILLFDLGNLRRNQSVLVHSAAGGVGFAVAQLCKTVEGVTLFGTASVGKHEALNGVVNHVYDHATDYVQEIRKVAPEGIDIVLDSLCGDDTNKGIAILKPLGKYILYGSSNVVTGETKSFFSFAKSWWQMDKISPIKLYDDNKTIAGFHLRQLIFKQSGYDYVRNVIDILFQLYNEGKIKPRIDSVWAFENIGDAMQKMHDRKNIGKVILDPSLEHQPSLEKPQRSPDSPREIEAGVEDKNAKKEETN
jgi:NADPH:quinone reductase-like Zn-dependent oxidoreductase